MGAMRLSVSVRVSKFRVRIIKIIKIGYTLFTLNIQLTEK